MKGQMPGFVGRSNELSLLREMLARAAAGSGGCALIEGEAGIGKTRLVGELEQEAGELGFHLIRGNGYELERERPFGVLADALGLHPRAEDSRLAELGDLLRRQSGDASEGDDRFAIVEAIVDLVEEMSLSSPVLLVVEDMHWADDGTVSTLHRLSRRAEQLPVCGLFTTRPTPRSPAIDRLARGGAQSPVRPVALHPLDEAETQELLRTSVGASPGRTLARLASGAGGNPLFLTELAAVLSREGQVRIESGSAEVDEGVELPSLELVIMRALSFLSRDALETLRLASVLGPSFYPSDLAAITRRSMIELSSMLDEATAAAILRPSDERMSFRHELVRDAVYRDIPLAVRRALHRDAARSLAVAGAPPSRVAAQYALGAERGDHEAIVWLCKAAEESVGPDASAAATWWRRALDLTAETDPERDQIAADLTDVVLWTEGPRPAEEIASSVLERVPSAEIEWQVRRSLWRALYEQERHHEAVEQLDDMAARHELSEQQRAEASGMRAMSWMMTGRLDDAVRFAQEAATLGEDASEPWAIMLGNQVQSVVSYVRGHLDEAIRFGHLARTGRGRREWSEGFRALPIAETALPLVDTDRLADAAKLARDTRTFYDRHLPTQIVLLHFLAGFAAYFAGDWDDAVAEAEAGLALAEEQQNTWRRPTLCVLLTAIAAQRDDEQRLARAADLLEIDANAGRLQGYEHYLAVFARALYADWRGDLDEAQRLVSEAWAIVTTVGAVGHYRLLGADHVRIMLATGRHDDAARAVELLDEASRRAGDVASAKGLALRCRGLVERDAECLLGAVDEYRKAPRPVELALACEDAGAALSERGDRRVGRELLVEAMTTYEAVGAARWIRRVEARLRSSGGRAPARKAARPVSGWESLTPSELRVVDAIAQGLTNRQAGERLFISARTVETHLGHIFAKLGISTRTELVAHVLRRTG